MPKRVSDSDAVKAGQVGKMKRAARRAADRLKRKIRAPYCTRVLIQYSDSDSMLAKFMQSALGLKRAATTTNPKMRTTFIALEAFAREARWGKVDPTTLTFKQFRAYIQSRIGKVCNRTIQNEASHIRRALRCVGRGEFAAVVCSSKALGIPSASRIGTGTVVHEDVLAAALVNAREDTAAILRLEHAIGLRGRESIQSGESLREWKLALANGQPIVVRKGPKGGRVRSVVLCPSKAAEAALAVDAALKVIEHQEHLVDSVNLKAALACNHKRMKKLGIAGKNAQHSLRRSFTLEQFDYYRGTLQMSEKKALSTLSNDLGHGDGRGRFVYNCYLRATLEEREAALAAQKSKQEEAGPGEGA